MEQALLADPGRVDPDRHGLEFSIQVLPDFSDITRFRQQCFEPVEPAIDWR